MIEPKDKELEEFLRESNAIEGVYDEQSLQDAKQAWTIGVLYFKKEFTIDLILGIHSRLMKNLNKKIAGHIRKIPIYVGNKHEFRECMKPELIKKELKKLINNWNDNIEKLKKMSKIDKENFTKQLHIDFERIHPFEDGNGRTGRILMNLQRLSIGLPILIIHEGVEQVFYYEWFKQKNE